MPGVLHPPDCDHHVPLTGEGSSGSATFQQWRPTIREGNPPQATKTNREPSTYHSFWYTIRAANHAQETTTTAGGQPHSGPKQPARATTRNVNPPLSLCSSRLEFYCVADNMPPVHRNTIRTFLSSCGTGAVEHRAIRHHSTGILWSRMLITHNLHIWRSIQYECRGLKDLIPQQCCRAFSDEIAHSSVQPHAYSSHSNSGAPMLATQQQQRDGTNGYT